MATKRASQYDSQREAEQEKQNVDRFLRRVQPVTSSWEI